MDITLYNLSIFFIYCIFILFRNATVGTLTRASCDVALLEIDAATSDYELEQATWFLRSFSLENFLFNPFTYNIWTIEKVIKYCKDKHDKTIPDTVSRETWAWLKIRNEDEN